MNIPITSSAKITLTALALAGLLTACVATPTDSYTPAPDDTSAASPAA